MHRANVAVFIYPDPHLGLTVLANNSTKIMIVSVVTSHGVDLSQRRAPAYSLICHVFEIIRVDIVTELTPSGRRARSTPRQNVRVDRVIRQVDRAATIVNQYWRAACQHIVRVEGTDGEVVGGLVLVKVAAMLDDNDIRRGVPDAPSASLALRHLQEIYRPSQATPAGAHQPLQN